MLSSLGFSWISSGVSVWCMVCLVVVKVGVVVKLWCWVSRLWCSFWWLMEGIMVIGKGVVRVSFIKIYCFR